MATGSPTQKILLAGVQEFLDAIKVTVDATTAEQRDASSVYHDAPCATHDERVARSAAVDRVYQEIDTRYQAGVTKAKEALTASTDPLVKWIMKNAWEAGYPGEAQQALEALTVGGNHLEELQAAAERCEWCNVWGRMRRQMIRAGVLDDGQTPRQRLDASIRSALYSREREQFYVLLEAVLAEAAGE